MKYTWITLLGAMLLLHACSQPIKNEDGGDQTTVVEADKPTGKFGASIDDAGVSSLAQLVDVLEAEESFEGKIVGQIKDVCSKKGCWMTIDLPNGETMRVTFKDYGFFVPKNSQGYPVIIEGVATKSVTDVATLKHYAEDAGKTQAEVDAITAPKREYAFEAIGVIISEDA